MCDTSQSCPQLKQDWDDSPVKIRGNAVALLYPSPSHHNPAAGWLSGVVPPVPVDSIDPLAAWQGPRMAQDGPGAGAKHSVARLTWMTWLSFACKPGGIHHITTLDEFVDEPNAGGFIISSACEKIPRFSIHDSIIKQASCLGFTPDYSRLNRRNCCSVCTYSSDNPNTHMLTYVIYIYIYKYINIHTYIIYV